jgi:acetyltransferase-like isoleucine patch superfamily enzyme
MTRLDRWEQYVERKRQLLRGQVARWRGARAGIRFGLGRGVRLLCPTYFEAADDVLIRDYSYLHCQSEGGVWFGRHTIASQNFWLSCAGVGFFKLGEYTYIGPNAVMGASGGITIGCHVRIGPNLTITAENHRFDDPSLRIDQQGVTRQGVVIEDDCWIGGRATILDGVRIGCGSVVGAGAVVCESIPPFSVVVGVPARVIRERKQ